MAEDMRRRRRDRNRRTERIRDKSETSDGAGKKRIERERLELS